MSSNLANLALDFGRAAQEMGNSARSVIHDVASGLEAEVRSLDGGDENVVVTYPGESSAHLGGMDATGVTSQDQGSTALASVDVDGAADELTSGLLDAGVKLVNG